MNRREKGSSVGEEKSIETMGRAEHQDLEHYHHHTQQELTQEDRPHRIELVDPTVLHREGQETVGIEGGHLRKDDEHTENAGTL